MAIDWKSYRADDRRCSAYIQCPAALDSVERCAYYDRIAERYIEDMVTEIENIKQYRQDLFRRMKAIYSSPHRPKITLRRERRDSVFYYLQEWDIYEDQTIPPQQVSCTKYTGTDRAKAISDYRAAVKAHPGIDCEMNIEKGKWER